MRNRWVVEFACLALLVAGALAAVLARVRRTGDDDEMRIFDGLYSELRSPSCGPWGTRGR